MAQPSTRFLSSAATLLASAYLASAHHGSNISYQLDKTITVTGTVTEWDMVNPLAARNRASALASAGQLRIVELALAVTPDEIRAKVSASVP